MYSSVNGVGEWVPHRVSVRFKWEGLCQVPRVLSDGEKHSEGLAITVIILLTLQEVPDGDRGRDGVSSLLQNLGRDRLRQCGWKGGDKRRQMAEAELGAEKRGLGARQGAGRPSLVKFLSCCWFPGSAGQGRAWMGGWLEAGILGPSSHLATWPLPDPS